MARARNIKPALFKNELLGVADPLLTILFTGLWCLADREGRLEDRPLRIKAEVFPYRDIPARLFNGYLTELQRLGFIRRFSVGGLAIIQVLNFTKHQAPHKTEKDSELPEESAESRAQPCFAEITVKSPLNNDGLTKQERPDSLIADSLIAEKKLTTKKFDAKKFLSQKGASDQLIADWFSVRKLKKLANTETSMSSFVDQVDKSGVSINDVLQKCCEKSWGGFKQEWLQNDSVKQFGHREETVYQKKLRQDMEWNEKLDRAIGVNKNEIIDIN